MTIIYNTGNAYYFKKKIYIHINYLNNNIAQINNVKRYA